MVHGGIITSLLYEVLENLPYYRGAVCMMKSLETRFRRPARIGKRIYAKSWLVSQSRRDMNVSATLESDRGEVIAEARAVLVELSEDRKARLGLD